MARRSGVSGEPCSISWRTSRVPSYDRVRSGLVLIAARFGFGTKPPLAKKVTDRARVVKFVRFVSRSLRRVGAQQEVGDLGPEAGAVGAAELVEALHGALGALQDAE